MCKDATFMALGGAQRIGTSCYFLRLGKASILLDAGGSLQRGIVSGPRFCDVLGSPYLESMKQITHIFISHAHNDHVAALLPIMEAAPHAEVYMTELTQKLAELQIDRQQRRRSEADALVKQKHMDRVTRVSYMQTIDCGGFRATFLPAGHIPGAMMVLLDDGHRKLLYTGDYSLEDTALTGACCVPEGLKIDTMIMCALHAKHPYYRRYGNDLEMAVDGVFRSVRERGRNVLCRVRQLTKGIELLAAMNVMNSGHIPIRISAGVMEMVELLESCGARLLSADDYDGRAPAPRMPYIYILTDDEASPGVWGEERNIDFSLHDDFEGMRGFVRRLDPRQAIMVHCAAAGDELDETIEQVILRDPDCRTQFVFPEEGNAYMI